MYYDYNPEIWNVPDSISQSICTDRWDEEEIKKKKSQKKEKNAISLLQGWNQSVSIESAMEEIGKLFNINTSYHAKRSGILDVLNLARPIFLFPCRPDSTHTHNQYVLTARAYMQNMIDSERGGVKKNNPALLGNEEKRFVHWWRMSAFISEYLFWT